MARVWAVLTARYSLQVDVGTMGLGVVPSPKTGYMRNERLS